MRSFLLHYHRPSATMRYWEFDGSHTAMEQRFADEKTAEADTEVVVLGASDVSVLAQTHSRYFMGDWGRAEHAE